MRAARLHGVGSPIEIQEVPYPEPGANDVVVRVAACGVCGSDVHFLEGMPLPGPLPMTLGHEPAGIVELVGKEVREWAPGDRVALSIGEGCGTCRTCRSGQPNCCASLQVPGLHLDGAFAEAVRVPAVSLVAVPEGVSLRAAAVATDCVASPYHGLTCRARLEPGERVAIIGVGGLGGQAVALARALEAGMIIAVDTSQTALERASRSGATHAILSASGRDPGAEILELTDGGADLVIECVGAPDAVALGTQALRPGGRVVLVGVGMEPPRIDLPLAMFAVRELTVLGSFGSHKRDLAEVLHMQAAGLLDIEQSISHHLPLEKVGEGLEMLRTKTGDPERIVIEMEP
jgi:D-arabinose 1-dehydrogenase-like Zn-dependent alcohol dehydrogenase